MSFLIYIFCTTDEIQKEDSINITKSLTKTAILRSIFEEEDEEDTNGNLLLTAGIWTVKLKHAGKLILSQKFLVIPDINPFEGDEKHEWSVIFEQFWLLNSICFHSIEYDSSQYLFTQLFPICNQTAYWSTHYPDPKTDMSSINNFRIL